MRVGVTQPAKIRLLVVPSHRGVDYQEKQTTCQSVCLSMCQSVCVAPSASQYVNRSVCLSLFLAFSQPVCLFLSVCLPGIRRPVTKPLTHPHPIALYFTAGLCSGAPQHPALVVAICQGELQWHRCIQPGAYLEHIVCTTQGTPRWEIWQMVGSVMDEGHAKTRRPPKPLPVRGAESNKHNQHQTNSRADASPACPSAPSVRQPRQSRVVKRCVELRCVSLSHANNANVADS